MRAQSLSLVMTWSQKSHLRHSTAHLRSHKGPADFKRKAAMDSASGACMDLEMVLEPLWEIKPATYSSSTSGLESEPTSA